MRRVIFEEFGPPEQVLRVIEAPVPEPGPEEVRVRLKARPINPADLLTINGKYGHRPSLPATPGYEGMGVVDAVGSDVTEFEAGQRVMTLTMAGTWQEYVLASANVVFPVPDNLSDGVASQALINPLTAQLLLFDVLKAKPGDWVIQTAAGSAVGRLVMQLATQNGINLINVVRRRQRVAELKALGAEHVVSTEDEDLEERVAAIAGKLPVTMAIDAVGGDTGRKVAEALGYGAALIVYGGLSSEPIPIDPGRLVFKHLVVSGFWLTDWLRVTPQEHMREVFGEVMTQLASEQLLPTVEREYDLGEVVAAIAHAGQPGRAGKIILVG